MKEHGEAKKPKIGHVWRDYVPNTFIEPHPYLLRQGSFDSINFAFNLWNNGKMVDGGTHYFRELDCQNLVDPSFLHRIQQKLFHRHHWNQFEKKCENYFDRMGIALIHSHFATTGCEIFELVDKKYLPHIVTVYGYDGSAALKNLHTVKKYQAMFRSIDRLIVLSQVVRDRFLAIGCPKNIIEIWNMPAQVERYPYVARKAQKKIRLLMAARFAEAKGHVYALSAIRLLRDQGYDVEATFLGFGNEIEMIRQKKHELRLEKRVRIIDNQLRGDFHQEFQTLLANHDIYLVPSITDSQGTDEGGPSLAAICAQSSGIPVVSTRFPGSEISLIEEETGLFCHEKDAKSLAAAIEKIILNPEWAWRMGRKASQLVNREFSETGQMEKLLKIYDDCLGIERNSNPPQVEPTFTEKLETIERPRFLRNLPANV